MILKWFPHVKNHTRYLVVIIAFFVSCTSNKKKFSTTDEENCGFRGKEWVWTGSACVKIESGMISQEQCNAILGTVWDQSSYRCKIPKNHSECQGASSDLVWFRDKCIPRSEESFLGYCERKETIPAEELATLNVMLKSYSDNNDINCESSWNNLKRTDAIYIVNDDIQSIFPLTFFNEVKSLELTGNKISNLEFIDKFPVLESLSLGNNQIESVQAIKNLKNLRKLILNNNKLSDISPLKNLLNLELLDLSGNPDIKDYSPIEGREFSDGLYK